MEYCREDEEDSPAAEVGHCNTAPANQGRQADHTRGQPVVAAEVEVEVAVGTKHLWEPHDKVVGCSHKEGGAELVQCTLVQSAAQDAAGSNACEDEEHVVRVVVEERLLEIAEVVVA